MPGRVVLPPAIVDAREAINHDWSKESDVLGARIRLAALWWSQVARIVADNCLRAFVVLELVQSDPGRRESAWHLVAALFVLPSVFLAPFNGAISNSLPKPRVLVGAAAYCLAIILLFSLLNGPWLWALALVAIGNALYSPTRYAMLPAAAQDAHLPLTRVNGWIEMGSVSAIVAGILLGTLVADEQLTFYPAMPLAIGVVLALNIIGLLAALPVSFPSDVYRPEGAWQAVRGFFRDANRIIESRETRYYMLALACLRGLFLVMPGALIATTADAETLRYVALSSMAGAALGSILAGVERHQLRALGWVPWAATGLCIALVWIALLGDLPPGWLCWVVGAMGGIINVPLFANYQAALPADARGNGIAVLNTAGYLAMTGLALVMFGLAPVLPAGGQVWLIVGLSVIALVIAWYGLLRECYEFTLELLFSPIFRIHGFGPGLEAIPRTGPLLILANHTAWFDPIFLAKVLPRQVTAMLTSVFYDLPVLNFLARRVVHAIRVADSDYRREAPELQEAIAALDRGEAVLIFPEGQMRKREHVPLHYFGRGVWHILKERPTTPVVVCWIEGAWGSYTSYHGGPPTKSKRPDFWRRIDVSVAAPQILDESILADHRRTRSHLMKECLEARRYLGLEPLSVPAILAKEPALAGDANSEEEKKSEE